MNRALLAALIFFSVAAFVGLQAWLINRWMATRLDQVRVDDAAVQADESVAPAFSRRQVRIYVGSFFVSWGLLVVGAILSTIGDEPSRVSIGLIIAAVVMTLVRPWARVSVERAALRARARATVSGSRAG